MQVFMEENAITKKSLYVSNLVLAHIILLFLFLDLYIKTDSKTTKKSMFLCLWYSSRNS